MEKLCGGKLACHGGHGDDGGADGVFQWNRVMAWDWCSTRILLLRGGSRIGNREAKGVARKCGHGGDHGGTLAGTHPRWRNMKCGLPRAQL